MACSRCGGKTGLLGLLTADLVSGENYCEKCAEERANEKRTQDAVRQQKLDDRENDCRLRSRAVILTTTPSLEGYRVVQYLREHASANDKLDALDSEVTSEFADFFGARSTAFEKKLREAKELTANALRLRAAEKGANAVLAVDLDYTEFSSNRVALIMNGTLVLVERE